jgi:putative DNA primase/helicase
MNLYNDIPDVMKKQHQWVVWGVPGELPKIPYNPKELLKLNAEPAKSGVPVTWSTFDDATKCVSMGLAKGIGYEFNNTGIYGIDFDNVIKDGIINSKALEIVNQLNSFTEISPSGKGLHTFVTASNINIIRHRKQGCIIEIYNHSRYFTMTGSVYNNFYHLNDRPEELQKIHDKFLQSTVEYKMSRVIHKPANIDYLQRGLDKDPILRACWNGERRNGDESASDQALMNKLAYWCCADGNAMISAFKQSPYYAQKSEVHKKKCERSDYLPNTAKVACSTLSSTAHEDTMRYQRTRSRSEAR